MTGAADASPLATQAVAASSRSDELPILAEIRSWTLAGAVALAIAGIFALLLAFTRVPGMERLVSWPFGFFAKGLAIHVNFSLVIWFLTVFAVLSTQATSEVSDGQPRFAFLGRLGLGLVSMSFPMLFIPAFHHDTTATLNNYIPVIIHPSYYLGLVTFAVGVALPVVRLFANVAGRLRSTDFLPFAMTIGGIVYGVAVIAFMTGIAAVWGEMPSRGMHEQLFWGGGHVLQFLYCILLLTGWTILARKYFGADAIDPDIFRLSIGLIGLFSLGAIVFCFAFPPFSPKYMDGFRNMQFVLAFPSLLIAASGLAAFLRFRGGGSALPWHDPGFIALTFSPIVFGVGGMMGLLITGSDTRTPAHYHGVIAGVQIASMGLMLTYCLPGMQRPPRRIKLQRYQLLLFGLGQLTASIGLFMAGGYGAPRKTPSGAINLTDGATAGMFLHGVGALLAVIGGVMFVATMLIALLRPTTGDERHGKH